MPQTPVKPPKDAVIIDNVRLSYHPYTEKEKSKFPPHIECLVNIYGNKNGGTVEVPPCEFFNFI